MEQSAWLQEKKSHRWVWIIAACALTLGAVAIFLRNNPELFKKPVESPVQAEAVVSAQPKPAVEPVAEPQGATGGAPQASLPASAVKAAEPQPKVAAAPDAPTVVETGASAGRETAPAAMRSIVLPLINCSLQDNPGFVVLVSVEVYLDEGADRDDVLARREELKVMVRSVFARRTLAQVKTDALRADIRRALNTALKNAPVMDVEFKDFRIEKATDS